MGRRRTAGLNGGWGHAGGAHHELWARRARELANRLVSIFLRGPDGLRPVFGGAREFQDDPHWRDHLLFYEYFHGDNGAGIGASHQTGWTGLVATLIDLFAQLDASEFLERGKRDAFETIVGGP